MQVVSFYQPNQIVFAFRLHDIEFEEYKETQLNARNVYTCARITEAPTFLGDDTVHKPRLGAGMDKVKTTYQGVQGKDVKAKVMRECGMRTELHGSRKVMQKHQIRHLREFLEGNREDMVPAVQYLRDGMYCGVPLLDLVNVHLESPGVHWAHVPTMIALANYRSIDSDTLRYMKVKAITLGFDHLEHTEAVLKWARERIAEDYETHKIRTISADVEDVHITSKYTYKLQKEYLCKQPIMVLPNDNSVEKQSFPGILMCGDGVEWMLVIQFPISRNKDYDFVYNYSELRRCEIEFLADMPIWNGLAVENDQIVIHDTIERVYGVRIPMPGTLSIGALFIANGLNLPFRNMVTVNLFVMGGALNKVVSEADNQWWNNWEDLPDELKIYCIGDIRFSYTNTIVLFAHLMESWFPDPTFLCTITKETLEELKTFLHDYILQSLMSIDGQPMATVMGSLSPQNIVDCLREWRLSRPHVSTKREMVKRTVPRVVDLVKMVPPWQMVCDGGCRAGLQARAQALVQMETLVHGEFKRVESPLTLKITRTNIASYPDFRVEPERIKVLKSTGAFQAITTSEGLYYPDELPRPVEPPVIVSLDQEFKFLFGPRVIDYVTKYASELGKILVELGAVTGDLPLDSKWARYSRVYHGLRDLYTLLYGPPPPMCRQLWDLQENIRLRIVRDIAPIRGGFAAATVRELANPDNLSNIQMSKLITDIVPGSRRRKGKHNKKAKEAKLREKHGDLYVRPTDRQRAAQKNISLDTVREFFGSKKRALLEAAAPPSPKKIRKTTWQDYKDRIAGNAAMNPSNPSKQGSVGSASCTVTSGSLEEELADDDLRHRIPKALPSVDHKSKKKTNTKSKQKGDGVFSGAQLEYLEMTKDEREDYLKTAKPAGWDLEFEAPGWPEDDTTLQIHWQECQETLDE